MKNYIIIIFIVYNIPVYEINISAISAAKVT